MTATPTVVDQAAAETAYQYRTIDGELVFEVIRRPGKRFVQRRPNGVGGWTWDLAGVDRIPYRWVELEHAAMTGEPVFVVEGEKDADRLADLGLVATTSPGGAAWEWPPAWAEHFRGCAQVVVIADNDEPGRQAARQRATVISKAVTDVRLLELPDVGDKGDVSDYLDADRSLDDLWRVADAAPSWPPPPDDLGAHDDPGTADAITSWLPVNIAELRARGLADQPPPTIAQRLDGVGLFYRAKTHAVIGEAESAKSWLALLASRDEIGQDHTVTYIDFEDDAETVIGRMLALGATWDELEARFVYVRPVEPIPLGTILDLMALKSTLVVVDGVTEAMALHDLDPDKNRDSAKFMKLLVRPLAMAGAAVVQVDHVTKNPEQRGKYAIGAQHKRAAITGAMYSLAVAKPFGRGMAGLVNITVEKDKPGHVRRAASGRKAAEFHISSNPDGTIVTAELRPPQTGHTSSGGGFRPTVLMERVSRRLEEAGDTGLTKNSLKTAVKGNNDHVALAAEILVADGYVTVRPQGQAQYHVSARPYRRSDDPLDPDNGHRDEDDDE